MNQNTSVWRALVVAGVLTFTVGGCIIAPAPRPYYAQPVVVEPPPPQVEVVGVAPYPGYVWLGGYWNWVGNRHVWVAGHWEAPRPGHVWVAHRWVHEGRGWRLEPGRWERR